MLRLIDFKSICGFLIVTLVLLNCLSCVGLKRSNEVRFPAGDLQNFQGPPVLSIPLNRIENVRFGHHGHDPRTIAISAAELNIVPSLIEQLKKINQSRLKPIKLLIAGDGRSRNELAEISRQNPDLVDYILDTNEVGGFGSWMQDYGEPAIMKLRGSAKQWPVFFDVWRDEFISISFWEKFLQVTGMNYFRIHPFAASSVNPRSGDFGGNIESTPNDILYMGSTSSNLLRERLSRLGYEKDLVILENKWLEVGHVDEMISTIPLLNDPCGFALVKASPELALDLMKHANFQQLETELNPNKFSDQHRLADLRDIHLALRQQSDFYGNSQLAGQMIVENRISSAASQLKKAIIKRTPSCVNIKVISVPTLFICGSRYSEDPEAADVDVNKIPEYFANKESRRCTAAGNNTVNLLSLGKDVMLLAPMLTVFKESIQQTMSREGIEAHFVEGGKHLNGRGGGLHCVSQVIREIK